MAVKKMFVYDDYLEKAHKKGEVDKATLKQYKGKTKKSFPKVTNSSFSGRNY